MNRLLVPRKGGLYAPSGDFYIDPSEPVGCAVVTHAHSDHARRGHETYICSEPSERLVLRRAIDDPTSQSLHTFAFEEEFELGNLTVSLHPAGHLLGSAQVRITDGRDTWVVSGDFKRTQDPTCRRFKPIKCDVFITEVTFGLPVYRWRSPEIIFEAMYDWWQTNRLNDQPSVLFGYSLGKAQRLLAGLNKFTAHPILVHGALLDYNDIYRDHGIELPDTEYATDLPKNRDYGEDLIVAPPSAFQSNWMKRFDNPSTALASGWMQIRGIRRRRGYDTGFVLSDHADWPALIQTVEETGANQVFATHGDTDSFCRYLNEETDIEAHALESLTTD